MLWRGPVPPPFPGRATPPTPGWAGHVCSPIIHRGTSGHAVCPALLPARWDTCLPSSGAQASERAAREHHADSWKIRLYLTQRPSFASP